MGDVYGTLQVVIQALAPLVRDEVGLISGLKDDVNAIQTELQSILAFLKNAEEKAEGDEVAKEGVKQIRKLVYDMEDAIERYIVFQRETALGKAKQYLSLEVRSIASTIKSLRQMSTEINKNRVLYGLTDTTHQGSSSSTDSQLTTTFFVSPVNQQHELVGLEQPKSQLITSLTLQTRLSTIAVVGMRGLGKSTIVASVYNDKTVGAYFMTRAWITLSQRLSHQDIFRSMMIQFTKATTRYDINKINSLDKKTLLCKLQTYLNQTRYMVVFDDVQLRDIELGTYLKKVLPANNEAGKILVTTLYENVAHAWLDGSVNGMFKVKPLPMDKAWELFCNRTFKSQRGTCPSHLHDLARGIVKKCGGLPSAIHAVSRVLSSLSDDPDKWRKVYHSLGFYMEKSPHLKGVHGDFMKAYYNLPYYLKPCFLYFGVFPRGCPLHAIKLIRLWIAEGFIRQTRSNLTLEEVGEEYMNELINLHLIKVESKDSTGKMKTVGGLNEFLHEIIITKLDELSFCRVVSDTDKTGDGTSRRLSIHENHTPEVADKVLDTITKSKSVIRSLHLINVPPRIFHKVLSKAFCKSVRLLKVLDLSNAPIDKFPDDVGRLLHLHYLSLRNTKISVLPRAICKLQNIQTLDLKQTNIHELPKEINQLTKLRHLLVYNYFFDFLYSPHCQQPRGVSIPEGVLEQFQELQKLAFVDLSAVNSSWMEELRHRKQLRKLGVMGLKQEQGKHLCTVVDGMKYLRTLSVWSKDKRETMDVVHVTSPPEMLKSLYLCGALSSYPKWVSKLHILTKVRLRWSKLDVDPLESLQWLPNLVELQLLEAYVGDNLKTESGGFQKLKLLHLLDLHGLKTLVISQGCMPVLEELHIGESSQLQMPAGIRNLAKLKTLEFFNMPSSFTDCLLPNKSYHAIVQHVPKVFSSYKHAQGYWQQYTIQ